MYIAACPDCTIQQIAEALVLTRRTVWSLIADLRRAGMLHVRKNRRRHHYTVNLDGPFLHPTINGFTLRPILAPLVRSAGGNGATDAHAEGNWTSGVADPEYA